MSEPKIEIFLVDLLAELRSQRPTWHVDDHRKIEWADHSRNAWPEADMVSIVVPDGTTGELLVKARVGLGTRDADKKIAQWVMKSSKPLVVNNGRIDLEPDVRETLVEMRASSLVSIPLIARKKVVGIINSTKVERGRFTQGSLEFLSVLARHAAMLIQTGNLLRDSEEKRAELERMLMKSFLFRQEGQKK